MHGEIFGQAPQRPVKQAAGPSSLYTILFDGKPWRKGETQMNTKSYGGAQAFSYGVRMTLAILFRCRSFVTACPRRSLNRHSYKESLECGPNNLGSPSGLIACIMHTQKPSRPWGFGFTLRAHIISLKMWAPQNWLQRCSLRLSCSQQGCMRRELKRKLWKARFPNQQCALRQPLS